MSENPLLKEIEKGTELKKTETTDKSQPQIEKDVHIKKNEIPQLLQEIKQEHQLKHTETVDKSAPMIEEGVQVKKSERPQLLEEIKAKGTKE